MSLMENIHIKKYKDKEIWSASYHIMSNIAISKEDWELTEGEFEEDIKRHLKEAIMKKILKDVFNHLTSPKNNMENKIINSLLYHQTKIHATPYFPETQLLLLTHPRNISTLLKKYQFGWKSK